MDSIIQFTKTYKYPYQIELSDNTESQIQPNITISRDNKSYGIFRESSLPLTTFQIVFFTDFSYRYAGPRHPESHVNFISTLASDIGQHCGKSHPTVSRVPPYPAILCIINVSLSATTQVFATEMTVAIDTEHIKLRSILSNKNIQIDDIAITKMSCDKIVDDMHKFVGDRDLMKYVQKGKPWDKRYIRSLVTSAKKDYQDNITDYGHFIVIDNNIVVAYFSIRPYENEKQIRLITYPGRGYGSVIIEYLRYTTHYAFVHPQNVGSNKLFTNNGYVFKGITDNLNLYYSQSPNVL